MGISDWAVLLRTDADLAYWLEKINGGPQVRPFAVVRFTHAVDSMHAYHHSPSGLYLILIPGATRKECAFWFDSVVRKEDVFTRPGSTYRPEGWDECADYVWMSGGADDTTTTTAKIPPGNLVSDTAWEIPAPPPAEWMVHIDTPEQLVDTLAIIDGFNAEHPNARDLTLRVTKVVYHARNQMVSVATTNKKK
jgi:hypothetical protein